MQAHKTDRQTNYKQINGLTEFLLTAVIASDVTV